MASKQPASTDPAQPPKSGTAPSRFATLRRWASDYRELGWIAWLFAGAFLGVHLGRRLGEYGGQTPVSFATDLALLAAACAAACLITWLIKRALIGDLTEGEVRAAVHHVREGTSKGDGSRFLLMLDAATSLATYLAVIYTWSVLS